MPTSKTAERLELALIRLEYTIADFNHRAALAEGEPDRGDLEALLANLLAANRLVLNALAASGHAEADGVATSRSARRRAPPGSFAA